MEEEEINQVEDNEINRDNVGMKVCNGELCNGIEHPLNMFTKSRGKYGPRCKPCQNIIKRISAAKYKENKKIKAKIYREKNRDEIKEYRKKYKNEHKEKIKIAAKIYYEENKEIIDKKKKIYDTKNKEHIKQRHQKYNAISEIKERRKNRYDENKEKIHDEFQIKLQNKDFYIQQLITNLKSADKRHNRNCDIDLKYINELITKQNNICIYSGVDLVWKVKGGINKGSIDRIDSNLGHIKGNCQLVTAPINRFKNNLTIEKFSEIIGLIKDNYNVENCEIINVPLIKDLNTKTKEKLHVLILSIKQREVKRRREQLLRELLKSGMDKNVANQKVKDDITVANINLDFDRPYLNKLLKEQNGRCKLSNVPLFWCPKQLNLASVDRIDSAKGYCKDNIQIVLCHVNFLKCTLSDKTTINIIEKIIKNTRINNI
jgi:hypothetical protein